jgi:hypothetical protein
LDCSTAFFTSIMSASETTSNEGIIHPFTCKLLNADILTDNRPLAPFPRRFFAPHAL